MTPEGWIPVTERMPVAPNLWVLVYADGSVNCMAWSRGRWNRWACSEDDPLFNVTPSEITHWHELRPPFEEPPGVES